MVPGLLYNPRKKMNARLLLLDFGLISAKFHRSFQIAGVSIIGTTTTNKTVSSWYHQPGPSALHDIVGRRSTLSS